jgi:clan AA aspartic protease
MTGGVSAELEAHIPLKLIAPDGREIELDAVIDTGFNGYLCAPRSFVASLALPICGHTEAELADGSRAGFPTFEACVDWFGRRREIPVLASGGGFMIGMSLLRGSRLGIDVEPHGSVEVVPRAE